MTQVYITLGATVFGTIVYGGITIKKARPIRAEDLLTFAMWCGAIVTGPYMVVAAFTLSKQPNEQTNALYLGIFGAYLLLLSAQKLHVMVRKLSSRKQEPPQVSEDIASEKSLRR